MNAAFQTVNISTGFFFGTHKHIYYHTVSELRTSVSNPNFCQRLNSFHSVVYWELVSAYYQVFNIYIYYIVCLFYIAINGIKVEYGILKITLQSHTG